MREKIMKAVRAVVFVVIVCAMFVRVQGLFGITTQVANQAERMINSYYEEPENTVDAVFIGNSHVHNYWQAAFAYREYGISSLNFSVSDMPASVVRNAAIEACKTQNPKVIVFDITMFAHDEVDPTNKKVHLLLKNMKFSMNYLDAIRSHCDFIGVKGMERLEYYFPIMQFHSQWKELDEKSFTDQYSPYLNCGYLPNYLSGRVTSTNTHKTTTTSTPISEQHEAALRELLEWCKTQEAQVEFVAVPVLLGKSRLSMMNYVGEIIREYGFSFINYNEEELYKTFGFEEEVDFQDSDHTNVNGAYKFTLLYAKHLIEEYGLCDHRGESEYQSWDERADAYYEFVDEYLTADK